MSNDELILRQQRLQIRCEQLRINLADQVEIFKKPLAIADQARKSMQWLHNNPEWPLGIILLMAALRPRRSIIWTGRLWWTWGMFKRARAWLAQLPLPNRTH